MPPKVVEWGGGRAFSPDARFLPSCDTALFRALNDRTIRLNSLLREVLSEIIRDEVRNSRISIHTTVMEADITNDLSHCKVPSPPLCLGASGADQWPPCVYIDMMERSGLRAIQCEMRTLHFWLIHQQPYLGFGCQNSQVQILCGCSNGQTCPNHALF